MNKDIQEDDIGATDFSGSFWIIFTGMMFVIVCIILIGIIISSLV